MKQKLDLAFVDFRKFFDRLNTKRPPVKGIEAKYHG